MLDENMVNIYYKYDNFEMYICLDFTMRIKIDNTKKLYIVES